MVELRQEAENLGRQLDQLELADIATWQELEADLDTSLDELNQSLEQIEVTFGLTEEELEQEVQEVEAELEQSTEALEAYTYEQSVEFHSSLNKFPQNYGLSRFLAL